MYDDNKLDKVDEILQAQNISPDQVSQSDKKELAEDLDVE
jgi:hypothetical protein